MTLFAELKRRNVFRVGIAYAITVWVLIQALSIFLPTFEAPEWVMKVISVLLIAGFPVVLIFAWAYELTPEGVKREKDIDRSSSITGRTGKKLNHAIMVLMALAIIFLLYERFQKGSEPFSPGVAEQPSPQSENEKRALTPPISRQSIAVLPFDNRSRLDEDEFFVEGIHDDLLTNLARIGSLKVISRTSVGKYRDTEKSIPEIAAELGVATVMEGAVQRAGNTVRINVQLIDAATDEHLWAEIFDREMTAASLFAIQSEISEMIASALKATLSPDEQQRINARPTENLAAYNAYLRGRQQMALRTSEGVDQAAAEFERAYALDPDFALAWASWGEAALLQMSYSDMAFVEAVRRTDLAVERALAIDPQLGEAHLLRAERLDEQERRDEAEAAYRRAIELSPGNATAYQWYGNYLSDLPPRLQEARRLNDKAQELDPLSSIIRQNGAGILIDLGLYGEAEVKLREVMELDPGFTAVNVTMARLMAQTGRIDHQTRWLKKAIAADPGRFFSYFDLITAYLSLDLPGEVEMLRTRMAEINPENPFLGWVDMFSAFYANNMAAALEAANWTFPRMGGRREFQGFFGFIHMAQGDYSSARQSFALSDPRVADREQWRALLEDEPFRGCIFGWLLQQTGDEETGQDLLAATTDYLVNELPRYVQHADRYPAFLCHAARGETELALTSFETVIDHGHIGGHWFWKLVPVLNSLRSEPRYQSALATMETRLAEQRANLERLEAEAGP